MEQLSKGLVINKEYKLNKLLGKGSFGEVWLAENLKNKQQIAIKFFHALGEEDFNSLKKELDITIGLNHPNLLVPKECKTWENRVFLSMEYCDKGDVGNILENYVEDNKNTYPTPVPYSPFDENTIWRFIRDIAHGLSYLHGGTNDKPMIVHQDIKPDNILIGDDGRFLITDFGISTKLRRTLTLSQSSIDVKEIASSGSVPYMGPEKFSSNNNKPILANDIWSLGVSIYEVATCELPFCGQGGFLLKNGAEMPTLEDKGWSKNIELVMQACLNKDTSKRIRAKNLFEVAQKVLDNNLQIDIINDIERFLPDTQKTDTQKTDLPKNDISKPDTPKNDPPKPKPKTIRKKIIAFSLTGVVLLAIVGCFMSFYFSTEKRFCRAKEKGDINTMIKLADNKFVLDAMAYIVSNSNDTIEVLQYADLMLKCQNNDDCISYTDKQQLIQDVQNKMDKLKNDLFTFYEKKIDKINRIDKNKFLTNHNRQAYIDTLTIGKEYLNTYQENSNRYASFYRYENQAKSFINSHKRITQNLKEELKL